MPVRIGGIHQSVVESSRLDQHSMTVSEATAQGCEVGGCCTDSATVHAHTEDRSDRSRGHCRFQDANTSTLVTTPADDGATLSSLLNLDAVHQLGLVFGSH